MKKILLFSFCLIIYQSAIGQAFYDVTPGDGNGLRFWGATGLYKISMAATTDYRFGPVTGYSIKSNMNNAGGWGWTWGSEYATPIAGLNTAGDMQIVGSFTAQTNITIGSTVPQTAARLNIYGASGIGTVNFSSTALGPNMSHVHFGSLGDWYIRSANSGGKVVLQDAGGNVGVGTTSPGSKLDILGGGGATIDLNINGRIRTGDAANYGGIYIGSGSSMFLGQVSSSTMGFYNNGAWRLVSDNNGNIGIGTTSPNQKLTVNGTIYGKEVKVDLSVPGPDYVFEDDYALRPLDELETFINDNKHLPEVPSAVEMEKNGINVSEMNMVLLKKIEELTLYVIEIKNDNKSLKAEIDALKRTAR